MSDLFKHDLQEVSSSLLISVCEYSYIEHKLEHSWFGHLIAFDLPQLASSFLLES